MIVKPKDFFFFLFITILAFFAIGYGITHIPSPFEKKAREYDRQRLNDLDNIRQNIEYYYQDNNKLPVALSEVNDKYNPQNILPKEDPETKDPYQYIATGQTTYQLCAYFATDSVAEKKYNDEYPNNN